MDNLISFDKKELEALYKIIKEYEKDSSKNDEGYYDDHYDVYRIPVGKKIIKSILKKVGSNLPEKEKIDVDKDFLRKRYHTFNNEINHKVYSVLEKAFSQLKTIEIKYFNIESAEFSKRKLDVYYKSMKYIIGYCHLREDIRKFRTSRIASAKLTNDSYKIPQDFNRNDY